MDLNPNPAAAAATQRPILIVEDALDIRETLRELLELDELPVFTAANGQLGLEQLARIPLPCLVLLDLMMPVMDGFQFLQALDQFPRYASLRVVLISANRNIDVAMRNPRVVAGLKKPFELNELMELVATHCAC